MSMDFNSLNKHFIFVFVSVFFFFIWFREKFRVREAIKTIFIIEPLHLFFPFSMEPYLVGVSVRYIKCLWLGVLEVLGLLIILGLGALKTLYLGLLWLSTWNTLLKLLLVVTNPVLFYIFTNGAIQSPSLLLVLLWHWGLLALGSVALFLWGFQSSSSRRMDWSVLSQLKEISWHLSCFGPWGPSMSWDIFEQWEVAIWNTFLWRILSFWIYWGIGSC